MWTRHVAVALLAAASFGACGNPAPAPVAQFSDTGSAVGSNYEWDVAIQLARPAESISVANGSLIHRDGQGAYFCVLRRDDALAAYRRPPPVATEAESAPRTESEPARTDRDDPTVRDDTGVYVDMLQRADDLASMRVRAAEGAG